MGVERFVGREFEIIRLQEVKQSADAAIVVVHGRRRVGKTTLVEHVFSDEHLVKLEGIEQGPPEYQMRSILEQLSVQVRNPTLALVKPSTWRETLRLVTSELRAGLCLFLEEFQWLANYSDELVAEIKYFWDNHWRAIEGFKLVLCGSSASFMVGHVIRSKALYNRALVEVPLKPFLPCETREFLGESISPEQALDAHLLVGGIPEYLQYIRKESSVYLGFAKNALVPGAFFLGEYERIFVSSLANNVHYRSIIEFLSERRYASRGEIAKRLGLSSGSNLTELLEDLEICGFIRSYVPFDRSLSSKLRRFELVDPYVRLYLQLLKPKKKAIDQGRFTVNPLEGLSIDRIEQWYGYSLETLCRRQAHLIARALGFHGVEYSCGAFFNRATSKESPGFQLDLVFERKDRVVTLCEVKHNSTPITATKAREILSRFNRLETSPRYSKQRVLIATGEVSQEVRNGLFFDRILDATEVLQQL